MVFSARFIVDIVCSSCTILTLHNEDSISICVDTSDDLMRLVLHSSMMMDSMPMRYIELGMGSDPGVLLIHMKIKKMRRDDEICLPCRRRGIINVRA